MLPPVRGNPKRLLVAGDTRGNYLHWEHVLLPAAQEHQVGGILQLGDFGYWPLISEGRGYLAWLSGELDNSESWLVFVAANHEDHKALLPLLRLPDGFVEVADRSLWAPRGQRWAWHGVSCLALGRAFSIGRQRRKLDSGRWGWFKEEMIAPEQAKRAAAGGPTDVLLTHDAPLGEQPQVRLEGAPKHSPGTQQSVRLVQEVAEATKPKLLLHGHRHPVQQVALPARRLR
ncbi:MAG: metallophosphoesterase [Candidatus Dormibacteria bacterium]